MYFSPLLLHLSVVGPALGPGIAERKPQKQEQHHERTRESEGPAVLASDVAVQVVERCRWAQLLKGVNADLYRTV